MKKKKPNQLQKHARIALHYSTPLAQELIGEPKLTEIKRVTKFMKKKLETKIIEIIEEKIGHEDHYN